MNKQLLSLAMFITPWLSMFLMNKKDLRRFMPAALFAGLTSGVILHIGYMANLWYFRDPNNTLASFGMTAIALLWVIKFTYGRFWLYTITNAILDLGFAFLAIPWFVKIGLVGAGRWTYLYIYVINFFHALIIYGYQKWQENRTSD